MPDPWHQLDDSDRWKLSWEAAKAVVGLLLAAALAGVVALAWLAPHYVPFVPMFPRMVYLGGLGFCTIVLLGISWNLYKIVADLMGGEKMLVEGVVESKSDDGNGNFGVVVQGDVYEVSESFYNSCITGQRVSIGVAPRTQLQLGIINRSTGWLS